MNRLFLWLTDVAKYANDNSLSYAEVMLTILNVAKHNGYKCSASFERSVCNDPPIEGISLEVDDVDGLCVSAGIYKSHFNHTTVDEWLSWMGVNEV